jgi:hypothetical protein
MKRIWLLAAVGLLTGVLALGAIACSDDDEDDDGGGEATATEEMVETPGETTEGGETPEAMAPVEVALEAMTDAGVTGTGTLSEGMDADHTAVEVEIDGGLTEGTHQNHIHTGSCAAQGDVEFPLTDLEAGADGSAPATTTEIETGMTALEDGNHYFAVHEADATIVACGDIPAM